MNKTGKRTFLNCASCAGTAQHVFARVKKSIIPHRGFRSHMTLANLGIDGDSFKGHLQWQLLAGLWRTWEHTAEWGSAGDVDPAHFLEPFDSSNHCQSRRIVAPGRPRTFGICLVIQVILSGLCSQWTLTRTFLQSQEQHCVLLLYLLSPWFHYPRMCFLLWTKRRPFSWVTVSFHSVVIGYRVSLCGLDNCTEIEVQWPCGAPTLGNCESLTAFKVNLFTPLIVW